MNRSVQPDWCLRLPLQQQSTLLLAARGPDGVSKDHPCKGVVRHYRACVLLAGRLGRTLEFGEHSDSFMSLRSWAPAAPTTETFPAIPGTWDQVVKAYFDRVDEIPHHYHLHLMHGAEILAYKHPDTRFRTKWRGFYYDACSDLHLGVESELAMDERLNDWDQKEWAK